MLLPMIPPTPIVLPPAAVAFTATAEYGADGPWSFNMNFGAASATRVMIAGITTFGSGGVRTITSASIGGVAATSRFEATNGYDRTAFYSAPVPTGTSGAVNISMNGPCDAGIVCLWAATDLISAVPGTTASSITDPATATMTIPSAGFGLGFSNTGRINILASATWVGLVEQVEFESRFSGAGVTLGGAAFVGPALDLDVSCTWSRTDITGRLAIFATWR